MNAWKEQTIVVEMSEQSAGVLLHLLSLVSGSPDTLGRRTCDEMRLSIKGCGVFEVIAFDERTTIEAKSRGIYE
jgi:hypothetical protein